MNNKLIETIKQYLTNHFEINIHNFQVNFLNNQVVIKLGFTDQEDLKNDIAFEFVIKDDYLWTSIKWNEITKIIDTMWLQAWNLVDDLVDYQDSHYYLHPQTSFNIKQVFNLSDFNSYYDPDYETLSLDPNSMTISQVITDEDLNEDVLITTSATKIKQQQWVGSYPVINQSNKLDEKQVGYLNSGNLFREQYFHPITISDDQNGLKITIGQKTYSYPHLIKDNDTDLRQLKKFIFKTDQDLIIEQCKNHKVKKDQPSKQLN